MGFSGQEYWSGLLFPSPEKLSNPRVKPTFVSLVLQADSLMLNHCVSPFSFPQALFIFLTKSFSLSPCSCSLLLITLYDWNFKFLFFHSLKKKSTRVLVFSKSKYYFCKNGFLPRLRISYYQKSSTSHFTNFYLFKQGSDAFNHQGCRSKKYLSFLNCLTNFIISLGLLYLLFRS